MLQTADRYIPQILDSSIATFYLNEIDPSKLCSCGAKVIDGQIYQYLHSGGWLVPGLRGRRWLYIKCGNCGELSSLWKVGIPRKFIPDSPYKVENEQLLIYVLISADGTEHKIAADNLYALCYTHKHEPKKHVVLRHSNMPKYISMGLFMANCSNYNDNLVDITLEALLPFLSIYEHRYYSEESEKNAKAQFEDFYIRHFIQG